MTDSLRSAHVLSHVLGDAGSMDRLSQPALLLDLIVGSRCGGCGARRSNTPCAACSAAIQALPSAPGAAFADRGSIARLIRLGKRGDWRRGGRTLARLALERRTPVHVDAVTWVPADRRRRARRGGHLPEQLAKSIARELKVPVVATLRRRNRGVRQRGLDRTARAANAREAFLLARGAGRVQLGTRILLVDDVRTTGATLRACEELLEAAGLVVEPLAIVGVNTDAELVPAPNSSTCERDVVGVGVEERRKFAPSEDYRLTNASADADGDHQHTRKASFG